MNREASGGLTGEDGCLFDVNHGIWVDGWLFEVVCAEVGFGW